MFRRRLGHILRRAGRNNRRSKARVAYGAGRRLGASKVEYRRIKETQGRKMIRDNDDDDSFISPEDLAEMSARFSGIIRDADAGYIMEFVISRGDAKEVVALWDAAIRGDELATALCLAEYGKIMRELKRALKRDDD